jgi:PAS domain S-box-containing protein
VEYVICTGIDITERKQAEELFKTLAYSSPIGIFIIHDGKFQFVNPRFQEHKGLSKEELLGRNAMEFVIPEDRECIRENAGTSSTFGNRPRTRCCER